jgi:3-hydroxyacyl-[acyl-carrier-protein] dehydratase
MRWYWIDRFIEFESGRRAKAIKNVSLAEDYLHDHFPGFPLMPRSLIIEGVAQTGGLLVCELSHFTEKVVLAKLPKVIFYSEVFPGDTLIYTAQIEYVHKDGALVTATSHKDGRLQAEMEIVFAHLNDQRTPRHLFDPDTFIRMMRVLRAFEVGRAPDGSPLEEPKDLSKIRT